MGALGRIGLVALVGVMVAGTADEASAHHRHYRHHARVPRVFVFSSQGAAQVVRGAGFGGGYFETGILGPSTADPYEHPGYGYDDTGRYRRGFLYPGLAPD